MSKVLNKLKSNNGATLMLALLFFVVCAVTGSMILVSATVSAGRLENVKQRDQNYFAVRSAVKMCEQQMLEEGIDYKETLVVVETVTENDDKETTDVVSTYTLDDSNLQLTDPAYAYLKDKDHIRRWLMKDAISNYSNKTAISSSSTNEEKEDAFNLKWFKGTVKDKTTGTSSVASYTEHQSIDFSKELAAYPDMAKALSVLNSELDIEMTSLGVLTYKVYNADTINGEKNKEKYYMTITADIDVPCVSTVDVDVDVDEDESTDDKGETHTKTTTTTTTTYTNYYKFVFNIRDIKKG